MLYFNSLNRFDMDVFQPMLEQMVPYGGVFNAYVYPVNSKTKEKSTFLCKSFFFFIF